MKMGLMNQNKIKRVVRSKRILSRVQGDRNPARGTYTRFTKDGEVGVPRRN